MDIVIAVFIASLVGARISYYIGVHRLDEQVKQYDQLNVKYEQLVSEAATDKQLLRQYKTLARQTIEAAQQSLDIPHSVNQQNAVLIGEGKHMAGEMRLLLDTTTALQDTTQHLLAQHERTLAVFN